MPSKKVKTKKIKIIKPKKASAKLSLKKSKKFFVKEKYKKPVVVKAVKIEAKAPENKPIQPVQPVPITVKPAPIKIAPKSPYVLDLKRLNFEKHVEDTKRGQTIGNYYQDLKNDLAATKQQINKFAAGIKLNSPKKKTVAAPAHPPINFPKETVVSEIDLTEYLKNRKPSRPVISPAIKKYAEPVKSKVQEIKKSLHPHALINGFALTAYGRRTVASFILASFLLVSPLWAFDFYQKLQDQRSRVLGVTADALKHLKNSKEASQANDFGSAKDQLSLAQQDFASAQSELQNLPALANAIISALPQGSQLKTGENLLAIGQKATELADSLVNLFSTSSGEENLLSKLSPAVQTLQTRQNEIKEINKLFAEIDYSAVPSQYRQQLEAMASIFGKLTEHVDELLEQASLIEHLLGASEPKRYLLVFQNNNELRATGGFMGSYAVLDIDQGKIEKLDIPFGGTYDLRAGLKANIQPPKPLTALNPRWEFQDANYFADFPTSAKKIMSLYQKSGGTTVDGVIAVNATFLKRLLELTGPIKLQESDVTVDAQNVINTLENSVEFGEDKEKNIPKKIIADLTGAVIEQVSHQQIKLQKIATTLLASLSEKEIQLYLANPELQKIISKRLWGGEIMETSGDYLNIVSTNIAGGKTNSYLKDSVKIDVSIDDNGEIINTIRLTRTHNGTTGDPLNGIKNNDYIRFYVPLNSQLISATGFEPIPTTAFNQATYPLTPDSDLQIINSTAKTDESSDTEIFQEGDKTVFANWIQISPNESKTVTIRYKLPFTLKNLSQEGSQTKKGWWSFITNEFNPQGPDIASYSLLLQKQSGKLSQAYDITIKASDSLDYTWSYPSGIEQKGHDYHLAIDPLEKDSILGIVFQSK